MPRNAIFSIMLMLFSFASRAETLETAWKTALEQTRS